MILDDDPEIDAVIRTMAAELQRPVRVRPDLAARVMAEVRRPPLERAARWVIRPRTITVSPLGALAAAAAIGALVFLVRPAPAPGAGPSAIAFTYYAPTASSVTLVGEFNDWDPNATPLRPSDARVGTWTVEVPLAPGRHEYAFLVDGSRWIPDPAAAQGPRGEFGEPNSVLTVAGS
jgi:predicted carbohydrate-binding protein with CBM48